MPSETMRRELPRNSAGRGTETPALALGADPSAAVSAPLSPIIRPISYRSLADEYTIGVPEFLRRSGVGRTLVYELIDRGDIETVLVGNRRLILVESWLRYIERRREAERRGEIRRGGNRLRGGQTRRAHRERAAPE